MESIKNFFFHSTTSKVNERILLFEGVKQFISEQTDLNEKAVQVLIQGLGRTLGLYHDRSSRNLCIDLILLLLKKNFNGVEASLFKILENVAAFQIHNQAPSRSESRRALTALKWSCVIVETVFLDGGCALSSWKKWVSVQASLLYGANMSGYKPIKCSGQKRIKRLSKKFPNSVAQFISTLVSEGSVQSCSMLAAFVQYDKVVYKDHADILSTFAKCVVMSKSPVLQTILDTFKPILQEVDHDAFVDVILPSMQKAILRNPENSLSTVCGVLRHVSIDLSRHSGALVKMLSQQIVSKNDANRERAVECVSAIAVQCSDNESVHDAVQHLFGVLKGSEGKLSLASQKVSVLSSVGAFASSAVGSGKTAEELASKVASLFITFLQQEVHENTLYEGYLSLAKWCLKFKTSVPVELINWFVKVPTVKANTQLVRVAFLDCVINSFKGDTLSMVEALIPYLQQTVEKASQQTSQIMPLTEALFASCVLCKLENVELKKSHKFASFWSTLLDASKCVFTSHKLLSNASDDALMRLITLASYLLLDHSDKMQGDVSKPFFQSLVYIMLNKPWSLRQAAMKTVKKLLVSLQGNHFSRALLSELSAVLRPCKVHDPSTWDDAKDAPKDYIPCRNLYVTMRHVLDVPGLEDDSDTATRVLLSLLLDAYHPCITQKKNHLWLDWLYCYRFDAHDFVEENRQAIAALVIFSDSDHPGRLPALTDLVRIASDVIMPILIPYVTDRMASDQLAIVTRDELEIMRTPSGQLWNMKIIDSAPKIAENKNVKRENKAYSFKDQLMEQELRRELEKKKDTGGAPGLGGRAPSATSQIPANLTKKQRELVDLELAKEVKIRDRMLKTNEQFQAVCDLTAAAIGARAPLVHVPPMACKADSQPVDRDFPGRFVPLVQSLMSLFPSPLASSRAQELFVQLATITTPSYLDTIGVQIAYATLRLCKPSDPVDDNWCQEDLKDVITRLASVLSKRLKSDASRSAPFFAYAFPFFRHALYASGSAVGSETGVMTSLLQLTLDHARSRAPSCDPRQLPRAAMLDTACQLVATALVRIQKLAADVLLATCRAGSGEQGCAVASMKEIELLLDALQSPVTELRSLALQGISSMSEVVSRKCSHSEDIRAVVVRRLWVAVHDCDTTVEKHATALWKIMDFHVDADICDQLLEDVGHHEPTIQEAAAASLHSALSVHDQQASSLLQSLIDFYHLKLERPAPELDALGRIVAGNQIPDEYQARIGVAFALRKISPILPASSITQLFSFYVPGALGDRHPEVREKMLEAAIRAVNDHGKDTSSDLLQVFEGFLRDAPTSESYDLIRQSVVILLGTLARHLDKDDPKVKPIVAKLTETLSTPSQAVQEAVARCLPALVSSIKQDAPDIVRKLLVILLESENFGERKGAAYGLAGMVKGLGIISFKQLDIISTLTEAIQDKKNFKHREGALLAFEMFCGMLGRLFEPYVVQILPLLLLCFGDGNQFVREAADNTAKAVMRNLSAHGVRLVLPSLLNAIHTEDSWRTKTGSAELLGAMAHCAPKQLSACLPSIVPKLCEVLTDSHPKVQRAGQQALRQIGSVIRNPEILAISDTLLNALSEPSRQTSPCLRALLHTKFIHFIDAPSLALILPVVERAFQDRSTDTRKMAAQIIGNMYSLTDQKDLEPYLPTIIPGLKTTLLDPVPEVRSIAAKALGAMVKGTGETRFEELLPWLMEKLTAEQSSVDRSGAAQGLSEVLAALGREKLDTLMDEVVRTAQSDTIAPHVRDGYVMLFIYLPQTFGDDFVPYIGEVIKPILQALADESEFVRATALRAGQRIITLFAETAIQFFLPELEKGLFDDNWRIRLSSIQLLGDLLYHISGVTGKMSATGEEDENFGTAEGFKAIVNVLGRERRDLVLSGLYIGRSDVALRVRQSALHVWKIIVPNTPRLLREILPTLFNVLISCLASANADKRQVAAKTLGDIVRKLGERTLPELIPILEQGLDSQDSSQRQGVCIGLTEIIKSCSKDAIVVFTDNLVPTVRKALCDPLEEVRTAAAQTFEHLHGTIGVQALDEILPQLLKLLKNEETQEHAVDGLRQIIAVKGRVVLPFIVPKLIEPPVNTQVLAFLSSVAGEALTRHLPSILKALLSALVSECDDGEGEFSEVLEHASSVVLSVEGEHGTRIVMDDLLAVLKHTNPHSRFAAISMLCNFVKNTDADYGDYIPVFLQAFVKLLADEDERVQREGWNALQAVTAQMDATLMQRHISSVRHALRAARNEPLVVDTGILPGFCLPKLGLSPLLPIFREGILNGAPEIKEQAAKALAESIQLLTPLALKPSVVNITGPLIRILGDRFSSNVRVAVLETLALLLEKVGIFLKPFLPQLQTTFCKALQDSSRVVRLQAGTALKHLSSIHTRIDPLFNDLHNNIKTNDDVSVRETLLQAMRGCITNGGKKISPKIKTELIATLSSHLSSEDDTISRTSAGCLGSLLKHLDEDEVTEVFDQFVNVKESSGSWAERQGRSTLLAVALKESCQAIYSEPDYQNKIVDMILAFASLDRVQIATNGVHAAAYLLFHLVNADDEIPSPLQDAIKKGLEHPSNDVKNETCRSLIWTCQQLSESNKNSSKENGDHIMNDDGEGNRLPTKIITHLIPTLLVLTRERNTAVRSSAESALISLLQLRYSDAFMQTCAASLISRDATSLMELHKQKLKRVASVAETAEEIDDTVIKS